MNSNMAQKYIHYFGNESSESLLEAYGIVTKNNIPIDTLNPKICPNCREGNTQDSKFCAKCTMILTYEAYNETVEKQQDKDKEIQLLKERQAEMEKKFQILFERIDAGRLS